MTEQHAEHQFEVDISSRTQLNELQRLEQTHGKKVHEWVDEGMPSQAMGTPSKMHAFRKRKGTPVPWNVEIQNEESVQRSTKASADTSPAGETGVPDSVREVISSSGQSLDGTIQRKMEDEIGGSFGDVQIHTGPRAANACESINARAFTVGNHVAFNQGEYDPASKEGQHVIAHELAHVRQQTGGAVSMLPQDRLELDVDADPQLEHKAESTARRTRAGSEVGSQQLRNAEVHIQRMDPHKRSATDAGLPSREEILAQEARVEEQQRQHEQLEIERRLRQFGHIFFEAFELGVLDGKIRDAEHDHARTEAALREHQDSFIQANRGPIEQNLQADHQQLHEVGELIEHLSGFLQGNQQQQVQARIDELTEDQQQLESRIADATEALDEMTPETLLEEASPAVQTARRQYRDQSQAVRQLHKTAIKCQSVEGRRFRPARAKLQAQMPAQHQARRATVAKLRSERTSKQSVARLLDDSHLLLLQLGSTPADMKQNGIDWLQAQLGDQSRLVAELRTRTNMLGVAPQPIHEHQQETPPESVDISTEAQQNNQLDVLGSRYTQQRDEISQLDAVYAGLLQQDTASMSMLQDRIYEQQAHIADTDAYVTAQHSRNEELIGAHREARTERENWAQQQEQERPVASLQAHIVNALETAQYICLLQCETIERRIVDRQRAIDSEPQGQANDDDLVANGEASMASLRSRAQRRRDELWEQEADLAAERNKLNYFLQHGELGMDASQMDPDAYQDEWDSKIEEHQDRLHEIELHLDTLSDHWDELLDPHDPLLHSDSSEDDEIEE